MFLRGIDMKKLLEILRLHYEGKFSNRDIEKVVKISRKTISKYIELFNYSGLPWPLPEEYQNEDKLSQRLDPSFIAPVVKSTVLNFAEIHKELHNHKHLTLQVLWEEYKESKCIDCCYSNFTHLYRKWLDKQPTYMRQVHKAGEKVFVDYSGDKVKVIDTNTGEIREAEIFVGVLGSSKYIYLEGTWSQKLCDWTMSHVRMFEHWNGSVPNTEP